MQAVARPPDAGFPLVCFPQLDALQVKAGLVPLLADLRARGKAPSGALCCHQSSLLVAVHGCLTKCMPCIPPGCATAATPHTNRVGRRGLVHAGAAKAALARCSHRMHAWVGEAPLTSPSNFAPT